jgi:hypothetical protein
MSTISGYAVFCEDIREEKSGGNTIVGVMRDNLSVPPLPQSIPKLGIFARIYFPLERPALRADIYMNTSSGERNQIASLEPAYIEGAIKAARIENSPSAGIIASIIFAPFEFKSRVGFLLSWNMMVKCPFWGG